MFLFSLYFILNFNKQGYNGGVEEQHIFILGLNMFLYMLVKHDVDIPTLILQGEWVKFAILNLVQESMGHGEWSTWSQEWMYGSVDRLLLGSWMWKKFKKQIQVKYITFRFLFQRLGPYLKKNDTYFRATVSMQERVEMLLHRLDNDDGLQSNGDLYEVYKNVLLKVMKEFYRVVRKHLQPIFVQNSKWIAL